MGRHSGYSKISSRVIRVFRISSFQNCYPKIVRKKKNPKIRVPKNSSSGSGIPEIPDKLSNVGGDRRKRRQELPPPAPDPHRWKASGAPPAHVIDLLLQSCGHEPYNAMDSNRPSSDQARAAREESLPDRGTAEADGRPMAGRQGRGGCRCAVAGHKFVAAERD